MPSFSHGRRKSGAARISRSSLEYATLSEQIQPSTFGIAWRCPNLTPTKFCEQARDLEQTISTRRRWASMQAFCLGPPGRSRCFHHGFYSRRPAEILDDVLPVEKEFKSLIAIQFFGIVEAILCDEQSFPVARMELSVVAPAFNDPRHCFTNRTSILSVELTRDGNLMDNDDEP